MENLARFTSPSLRRGSCTKPYLDPNQCGVKGSSINHYLIKLLHFVHATLDQKTSHVVLAACFGLSKAFNRVDHSLVIQDLFDMNLHPGVDPGIFL